MSADGGSNAIGSIQEFEVVGQEKDEGGMNNTDFNVCFSHQNEWSWGYAYGAVKFTSLPNEPLGEVLKKHHTIQQRINRHTGHVQVYREV